MKIRFTQSQSFERRTVHAGEHATVPAATGRKLIEDGNAIDVNAPEKPAKASAKAAAD